MASEVSAAADADGRPASRAPRRGEAGFTLLEMIFAVAIVAVTLQATVSSTVVMTRSGEFGTAHMEQQARAEQLLEQLLHEVRTSSRETDPTTDEPYLSVGGTPGDRTLTFRRVAAFGTNGSQIVPIFTSPIEICREKGALVRKQDGVTKTIMQDVESLDFAVDELGRVDIKLGTHRDGSSNAGASQRAVHLVRVDPQR